MLLGLKQVDLKQFIVKFNEDKEKYKNYKDENGKFSERQILNILFNKLFSFVRMQELLADGLSKSDAIQIVIRHGNPKAWWEKAKGIRDELVGDGLSRSDATRLVIKHANPKIGGKVPRLSETN